MRPSASVLSVESTMEICALCNAWWSRLQNQRLRTPRARTELHSLRKADFLLRWALRNRVLGIFGSRIWRERREKERWEAVSNEVSWKRMRPCVFVFSYLIAYGDYLCIFCHRQNSEFSFRKIIYICIYSTVLMSPHLSEILISWT